LWYKPEHWSINFHQVSQVFTEIAVKHAMYLTIILIYNSLISIATSIGAAGIPQVGMVIIITVLNSVGLPTEYVAYIMPVDWLL